MSDVVIVNPSVTSKVCVGSFYFGDIKNKSFER